MDLTIKHKPESLVVPKVEELEIKQDEGNSWNNKSKQRNTFPSLE